MKEKRRVLFPLHFVVIAGPSVECSQLSCNCQYGRENNEHCYSSRPCRSIKQTVHKRYVLLTVPCRPYCSVVDKSFEYMKIVKTSGGIPG